MLKLAMCALDREIDLGIYQWRCTSGERHARVELQQRYLLLPRYWLLSGDTLLTLGRK